MPGEVITFYSYKGGTGRSMALANVACLLARRGHRVLAIDWDLDAPGLHRFLRPFKERRDAAGTSLESLSDAQEGVIDIFVAINDWLDHSDFQEYGRQFPSDVVKSLLNRTIFSTEIPKLDMLNAGRSDNGYSQRVQQFNWEKLFRQLPELFLGFIEYLATQYEYVLIDSRTGITDIAGICTMLMPEKLVAVFTPNQQSLIGVLSVMRNAVNYRLASSDLRPLTIFPLPSRVDVSEAKLRYSYRFGDPHDGVSGYEPLFEELFREIYFDQHYDLGDYFDEVQIPYVPFYAYGEKVAVLRAEELDRFSLSAFYKKFAAVLTSFTAPWEYRGISHT